MTIETGEFSIAPDVLFQVGGLSITNSLLSGFLLTLVIIIFAFVFNLLFKPSKVPGKFQLALELGYSMLFNFLDKITNRSDITKRLMPLVAALFIYIAVANVLPILPIYDSLRYGGAPLFRGHTIDLSTTLGLAVAMVIGTQVASIGAHNIFGHIDKYLKLSLITKNLIAGLKQGPGALAMGLLTGFIELFVGLLDLISEVFKSVSLSLRLLGNMFAGQLLVNLMYGFFAFLAFPLLLYSIFAGLIQALVFAALTASYFSVAMKEE